MTKLSKIDQFMCICINDWVFDNFKKAGISKISVIITSYITAFRFLISLFEMSFNKQNININSYSIIINEAHMLLNNISLMEVIGNFISVGFISATFSDISSLSIFNVFHAIKPKISKWTEFMHSSIKQRWWEDKKRCDLFIMKVQIMIK